MTQNTKNMMSARTPPAIWFRSVAAGDFPPHWGHVGAVEATGWRQWRQGVSPAGAAACVAAAGDATRGSAGVSGSRIGGFRGVDEGCRACEGCWPGSGGGPPGGRACGGAGVPGVGPGTPAAGFAGAPCRRASDVHRGHIAGSDLSTAIGYERPHEGQFQILRSLDTTALRFFGPPDPKTRHFGMPKFPQVILRNSEHLSTQISTRFVGPWRPAVLRYHSRRSRKCAVSSSLDLGHLPSCVSSGSDGCC